MATHTFWTFQSIQMMVSFFKQRRRMTRSFVKDVHLVFFPLEQQSLQYGIVDRRIKAKPCSIQLVKTFGSFNHINRCGLCVCVCHKHRTFLSHVNFKPKFMTFFFLSSSYFLIFLLLFGNWYLLNYKFDPPHSNSFFCFSCIRVKL